MRRFVLRLAGLAFFAAALAPAVTPAVAPAQARHGAAASATSAGQPPHAWLFGTWTGGLFPPPSGISAEACLSQPVVIFTRDIVLRATLMDQFYIQRLIETALTTSSGTQFHFVAAAPQASGLLAGGAPGTPSAAGFGCASPDMLDVERRPNGQIAFPNCGDFPYPLVRCPSR
jgi:hypothetical protein